MNEDTYRIRKHMKKKLIEEHKKGIEWHEKEIRKIQKQSNRLTSKYNEELIKQEA